jgi:hypothetical protein
LVKNIDSPDSIEMARRVRIPLMQQGVVQPTDEEKKTTPPAPQNPAHQLEMQLMQAKLQKATADATIGTSKATASHLEGLRLMYETAGKHLANQKMAQDMHNDALAAQAEREAAAADQQAAPAAA